MKDALPCGILQQLSTLAMLRRLIFFTVLSCCFFSCKTRKDNPTSGKPLFSLQDNNTIGISFINKLTDNEKANIFSYRSYYNGGGVAIGDVNNDGLNDIYLSSNQGDNKLYINKGNWKFEDITEKAGVKGTRYWSTGVTMADVNADGWLDIYVCNSGNIAEGDTENELFINQHDGTFKEQAAAYQLNDKGLSTHAVFFDFDLDGDLDCYVLNNSFRPSESFDLQMNLRTVKDKSGGDRLYRNDNNLFIDITDKAGIYSSDIGFGLGVSVCDINNDGYPDIYVSNDFFEKDYLYINQKNGTFSEQGESMMGHMSLSSMGSDIADINNDGRYDVFTTEMVPENDARYKSITAFESYDVFKLKQKEGYYNQYMQNCLQLNDGSNHFSEIANYAGVPATDWSWGALLFDMDNDGWKDIFVSNGIYKDLTSQDYIDFLTNENNIHRISRMSGRFDYKYFVDKMSSTPISNYAFLNNHNLGFINKSAELGFDKLSFSNGAAYGDLDNDGDNDLVINNVNMPLFFYKNNAEQSSNHFISIHFRGSNKNPFAIGAAITAFVKDSQFVYYHQASRGFQSSSSPNECVMGIGANKMLDSLRIIWPDGNYTVYKNLKADSSYTLAYRENKGKYSFLQKVNRTFFTDISAKLFDKLPIHKENEFIDYNRERLILQTAAMENPYMAEGDINGDGLTDFYFGNAKGTTASIYVQQLNGNFHQYIPEDFKKRMDHENAGAVFGDFDRDGDQDLIITCGGNETGQGTPFLNPAFFENDGKGNLKLNGAKYLPASINSSVIRACDYDKDGDLDLFIGARSVPGEYGSSPPSMLLDNDGSGNFSDVTVKKLGNGKPGMITDAQWADIDKNGYDDLIITGHWMGIIIYKNNMGSFTKDESLAGYKGFWNCLSIMDIDKDGQPDIIAGNMGLNSKLHASEKEPIKMYSKDFDDNGTKESVISVFKTDHKEYVFHQRKDLAEQMPSFKKKFLRYADYAGKEFSEIFTAAETKDAELHEVNVLESSVFYNKGNKGFEKKSMPAQAQLSSVHAIISADINKDGNKEIMLFGNFTSFKPEMGALDANRGQVYSIKNASLVLEHNLGISGDIRSALLTKSKGAKEYLLLGKNNATLTALEIK